MVTHFAASANFDSRQTEEQIEHFEQILTALRASGHAAALRHASSTNSIAYERRNAWGRPRATRPRDLWLHLGG